MTEKGALFTHLLDAMSHSTASGDLPKLGLPIRWNVGQPEPKKRGRPRGTGHPKVKHPPLIPMTDLDRGELKRAGLTDADCKYLYLWFGKKTFVGVAKELGVTPQAVHNRFHRKIFPALKKRNPKFSYRWLRHNIAVISAK